MKRILIVDQHLEMRCAIRMTLRSVGHDAEIIEAADAATALAMARALMPELVLTEVAQPGTMDGLALCRALRAELATRSIDVVIISARVAPQDRAAGLQAGARAYLTKPFLPLDLVHALDDIGATP